MQYKHPHVIQLCLIMSTLMFTTCLTLYFFIFLIVLSFILLPAYAMSLYDKHVYFYLVNLIDNELICDVTVSAIKCKYIFPKVE